MTKLLNTGKYVQMEGDKQAIKRFDNGKAYLIVSYSALNAGIIGTERNGVAIIDLSANAVVVDEKLGSNWPLYTPQSIRNRAVDQIVSDTTDFVQFAKICTNASSYRGHFPDLESPENGPGPVDRLAQIANGADEPNTTGPDIRPEKAIAHQMNAESEYSFPDKTREEIIGTLSNHAVHRNGPYGRFHFSWDIKIYNVDPLKNIGEFDFNPDLNDEWKKHVETDQSTYNLALQDVLDFYLDGHYGDGLGIEQSFELSTQGRSGGHMVLSKFEGSDLSFESKGDLVEVLKEMDDTSLGALYYIIGTMDVDLTRPKNEAAVEYALSYLRNNFEEEHQINEKNNTPDIGV